MSISDQAARETALTELDFHKTEFSDLREEILHWLEEERQYMSLCLVAIGAEIGLSSVILENRAFSVLLLFPFVFQAFLWEMLNAVQHIHALSSYLTDTLIPRVNEIFNYLGNENKNAILGWELQSAQRAESGEFAGLRTLVLESIMPTRLWMPILATAASIIAYIFVTRSYAHSASRWELGLILINLVFLVVSAIKGTLISRSAAQRARRFQHSKAGRPEQLSEATQANGGDSGGSLEGSQVP